MRYEVIARGLRALRHRRGWRQRDVSERSNVSRSVVADFERGNLEAHQLAALMRVASTLGATVRVDLTVAGGDLHRLLDADHAAIQSACASMLERAGWSAAAEVTFNNYGERGSIDLLAHHPDTGTLLVVEVKTAIIDIQALLAGMDRKVRVARTGATERGWIVRRILPALVVAEGTTARRRIADHAPLFARFDLRGRGAMKWLRSPDPSGLPSGLLLVTKLPQARSGDRRRAGRQRIRRIVRDFDRVSA